MSRMGSAQHLSVAQLQQAVQDGTLPAYVGIPMIQDKMKQEQEAKAGQQAPQQPPIADQIMSAAKQSEAQKGIDAAQSNLPEMSAAEGGIMSYANGGDVDSEDYDDYLQQQQDDQDLQFAEMAGQNADMQGTAKEPSYVNRTPNQERGIKTPSLDSLISHILKKESGNRDYDAKGNPLTSSRGAKYAMQVMPETAASPGFGINPAKSDSPEEYNRVGRELASALLNKYQDPKLAAAAYNWGSGNVDKWIAKGSDESKMPKETQNYMVSSNFAAGGIASIKHYDGDTDGSLVAADNPALQRSYAVSEGIRNLGPSIANAFTNPRNYDPMQKLVIDPASGIASGIQRWGQTPLDVQAQQFRSASMNPNQAPTVGYSTPAPASPANIPGANSKINSPGAIRGQEQEMHPNTKNWGENQPASNSQTNLDLAGVQSILGSKGFKGDADFSATKPETKEAPQSEWDKYMAGLNSSREDLKSQKEEDKYLSLMAAGLGMLKASGDIQPGKVHTAFGDIASGGLEGLGMYANLSKQRASEENALNKEFGSAMYRQEALKNAALNKSAQQQLQSATLEEQIRAHRSQENQRQENAFQNWTKMITSPYDKRIQAAVTDEDKQKLEQERDSALYNNPVYRKKWNDLYPDLPLPAQTGGAGWSIKPQ
jgi:hypothetical protein